MAQVRHTAEYAWHALTRPDASWVNRVDRRHHWSVLAAPSQPGGWLHVWDIVVPMDFTDPLHGWALSAIAGDHSLLLTSDGGLTWIAEPLPS